MPRTRLTFASKAFTERPWTFARLCLGCFVGGILAAVGLALLFAALG